MEEIYLRDKFLTLRQSPNVNSVASFVLRMVGGVPGIMPNVDTAKQYLSDAGFTGITEYPVTDMMKELGQTPPVDVISIMVAHLPLHQKPVKPLQLKTEVRGLPKRMK